LAKSIGVICPTQIYYPAGCPQLSSDSQEGGTWRRLLQLGN
jgi:hypothetical protein